MQKDKKKKTDALGAGSKPAQKGRAGDTGLIDVKPLNDAALGDEQKRAARAKRAAEIRRATKNKKKPFSATQTVMKLSKSVRSGGKSTIQHTKKAITQFNTFTQSPQSKRLSKLRGVNMTFPLFIGLSFLILIFALMALDNSSVHVDHQTISLVGLPEDMEGYKILQISDLHGRDFGAHQASLLRTINAETYNLVVFTGDMVGSSGNAQPFYDLLKGLTAKRSGILFRVIPIRISFLRRRAI